MCVHMIEIPVSAVWDWLRGVAMTPDHWGGCSDVLQRQLFPPGQSAFSSYYNQEHGSGAPFLG